MAASETNPEFTKLKSDLSTFFCGNRLRWLKFILFDHIPIGDLTEPNAIGNDLFNHLEDTGVIAPNNVNLLLDISKLCQLKKAEDCVVQYIRDNNIENTGEEKISSERKQMFKDLRNVGPDALKRVISHYNLAMYEDTNIWDVTFKLETGQCLSKQQDKKDVFDDLRQIVHHSNVPQRSGSHEERRKDEYDDSKASGSNRRPEGNREGDDDKCVVSASKRQPEEKIKVYLLSKQQTFLQNAKTFTPATWNESYQVDISELFTELDLLKRNKNTKKSESTTLKDVLATIKSTHACKVLIDGEGGIGKTTLLRHIAYNAGTDKSFDVFEGKIVFLLNIRDLEEGKGIFDLMVDKLI
ncbi:uncharacterized protein [Antedon mediterranea]|uniref:uncharacterized protein n=1 Tax=Antedon mediterranea TaxID=105859 RepID=UPI003AF98D3E